MIASGIPAGNPERSSEAAAGTPENDCGLVMEKDYLNGNCIG